MGLNNTSCNTFALDDFILVPKPAARTRAQTCFSVVMATVENMQKLIEKTKSFLLTGSHKNTFKEICEDFFVGCTVLNEKFNELHRIGKF
jgi:hypothetical protein